MSKVNGARSGCKDVFHAFLVKNAEYDGELEIPKIRTSCDIPNRVILFSKAIRSKDYDQWVCFYEDDVSFERIWNNPIRYLPILKKFKGVISPDFSLYRDMPLVMQQWNVYRSHAIASWLNENGIPVIPNIRWGDERSFDFCCLGIEHNSTIAIGSHGCIKLLSEREWFARGLDYVVKKVRPKIIAVYGTDPDYIFDKYKRNGIRIVHLDTDYNIAHQKAGDV